MLKLFFLRGNYYWELKGLPDIDNTFIRGPFKIWYQNMAPISKATSTITGLSGNPFGVLYKFYKLQYWSWDSKGEQTAGGVNGTPWSGLPSPNGLSAAYHDGNKTNPVVVGFGGIRVYYYDTRSIFWWVIGSREGYIGGQYGENFPAEITSAFSWPSEDPKVRYYVFLFRKEEFCFRPYLLKSGKDCDEWKSNKLLFCPKDKTTNRPTGQQTTRDVGPGQTQNAGIMSRNSLFLFLAIICFKLFA